MKQVTEKNNHEFLEKILPEINFRRHGRGPGALKPGGVLGVVEHRASEGTSLTDMKRSGYMTEAYVIGLTQAAGFRFAAKSEVNANPKDTKVHPRGVWTLPPSLRLGDNDRAKYLEIGESDRMTLRFAKL